MATLCQHRWSSCPYNALRSFGKVFLMAFGAKMSISVVLRILRYMYRVLFTQQKTQLESASNSQKISNKFFLTKDLLDALQFGLFLGTLAFSFNSVLCVLRAVRKKEDGWNAGISGGISGLSLFLLPKESRTDLSIYLFIQALANVARLKIEKSGIFPRMWSRNIIDVLIFSLFGGLFQYAFVWEPDTLDYGVYNLLFTLTSKVDKQALKYLRELCYKKWPKKEANSGSSEGLKKVT